MLAELNSKVEASSREVSLLQSRLSDSHGKLMEERSQRNKAQEDQLKGVQLTPLLIWMALLRVKSNDLSL